MTVLIHALTLQQLE